ncbi:hypothetical protein N7445_001727 [Penicillium cf. griseofulvum]|nr:hypothetical protein N7445_001727 [Penicillium cf. griseofulvum]
MTQKLDLGRFTLQIRESKLQLRVAASAHFNQPPSHEAPQVPLDLPHLSNLEGVWITEAPELELRFFIGGNWDRDKAAAFVSQLRGKLYDMEIWSEVGFSVELKTGGRECCIDTPGFHCLKLGLHRGCRTRNQTTGRTLPSSMTNPPDACPPTGVPVATLASIDVWLEYNFHAKDIPQAQDYSTLEVGLLEQEPPVFRHPRLLETGPDVEILQPVPSEGFSKALRSQSCCISGNGSNPSCDEPFQLFNFGIQRLVISNSIKDPTIRVPQQGTIKSLADLYPMVFDPGYRDEMNQRGVTIPIITKAISSMLAGNKDPSTKTKLADLVELTRSHHTDDPTLRPQVLSCRAALLSSLWRVAQEAVPKLKPIKRRATMLSIDRPTNGLARSDEPMRPMYTDQLQPENGSSGSQHSFLTQNYAEDEESDVPLLNSESEDQLLDNISETSFTDIGESTQTSLDTLCSTIGSSRTSYGDHDTMLLSNHSDLVDHPGNYVTDHHPREDMEAYDTEIIMADDL